MFPKLKNLIDGLDVSTITADQKALLDQLSQYINSRRKEGQPINLNFICTHNSRRSHLGQVWAAAMADHYKIENVLTFSGGTETTAVFPMILKTLEDQFFEIEMIDDTDGNPMYSVAFDEENPQYVFSKVFDDSSNPEDDFAAIMTCSQADEGCPFIAGADQRIAITYEDPKISDDTDQQEKVYRERSEQIATEMKYVFSKIN